jgi:hypothetical protein
LRMRVSMSAIGSVMLMYSPRPQLRFSCAQLRSVAFMANRCAEKALITSWP